MKAGVAHRAVAAERQVHEVGGALDLLGKLAVLEAADQVRAAVRPVVDVQEVVVGLDAEAAAETQESDEAREPQSTGTRDASEQRWKRGTPRDLFCISRQRDKKRSLPER